MLHACISRGGPPVKGDKRHRRTQSERTATTRALLLSAGRELFAAKGFAGAGREEIVERAGVTRGAMYHHFASKEELFRVVYEQVEHELTAEVATAALSGSEPMEQLRLGAVAFLDAASRPDVRRIVLLDGPSVLAVEVRREISERYGLGLVRESLRGVMAAGLIDTQPLEPLAHMLLAALHEAAILVADGADRAEVGATVERMISRL